MENNIEEFNDIIKNLVDGDLSILHKILMLKDEMEQIKMLRNLRDYITFYPNLYNAYTARVLVDEPCIYLKDEIVYRFTQKNLYT